MDSNRITTVLSLYRPNAEYLDQQLQSLKSQTIPTNIVARIDGDISTAALNVLTKYKNEMDLEIINGSNLGFSKSFLSALDSAIPTDYYAFCDQDDEWLPNKIERAIEHLDAEQSFSSKQPVLYFSQYETCDKLLNAQNIAYQKPLISFANSLTQAAIPGMVMVFNEAMRSALLKTNASELAGHDWLAYMIACSFGHIIQDSTITLKYRRHDGNVSNGNYSPIKLLVFRIKTFLIGDSLDVLKRTYIEFERCYGDRLSAKQSALLSYFLPNGKIKKGIKKFFYPHRYRRKLSEEAMLRGMFLLGKL